MVDAHHEHPPHQGGEGEQDDDRVRLEEGGGSPQTRVWLVCCVSPRGSLDSRFREQFSIRDYSGMWRRL